MNREWLNELETRGFATIPGIFNEDEVEILRREADRVQAEAGSACVRHLASRSPVYAELSNSRPLRTWLPEEMGLVRGILFDKTPSENWPVRWHQDLTIAVRSRADVDGFGPWSIKEGVVHVQAPVTLLSRMITLRIHLDDTTAANGALMVIPGSHSMGKIDLDSTSAESLASPVCCECRPGDILAMSPLIVHASKRSENPDRRRVIHFEYADTSCPGEGLEWHESLSDLIN
ncbi:MAG: phytanoyl-CoA dioxygenase family protein [Verrucomicrobiae bacterium]|nr:phytanoyl-CoA dioxygenase family protein [Verrucomicrobiae bacterium]